jgi:hypothetical protein
MREGVCMRAHTHIFYTIWSSLDVYWIALFSMHFPCLKVDWSFDAFHIKFSIWFFFLRYTGVWLITRCSSLMNSGYDVNQWHISLLVLILNGIIARIVAFFGLVMSQKRWFSMLLIVHSSDKGRLTFNNRRHKDLRGYRFDISNVISVYKP